MECNIILKKKLGEGGEGAAYYIKLKNDDETEKNNMASKEFNYSKHDGDSQRIQNFLNKVYNEFKMV